MSGPVFGELKRRPNGMIAGREIHRFLGVKEPYRAWMDRAVAEMGLVASRDYVFTLADDQGADLLFTDEVGKGICMQDPGPKGFEIRDGLFNCVRVLRDAGEIKNEDIPPGIRVVLEAEDRGEKHVDGRAFYAAMTGGLVDCSLPPN